jgi:hypothetical protein
MSSLWCMSKKTKVEKKIKEEEIAESLESTVNKEPVIVHEYIDENPVEEDPVQTEVLINDYKIIKNDAQYNVQQEEPLIKEIPKDKMVVDSQDAFDTAINPGTDKKLRKYKEIQQEKEKESFEEYYRIQHGYDDKKN